MPGVTKGVNHVIHILIIVLAKNISFFFKFFLGVLRFKHLLNVSYVIIENI